MDVRDAIEQAYRNGYEAGVKSVTDNNVGGKMSPTDREKLIDVFMHMGDHIRNLDEYGFGFDSTLAKAVEDVVAMLKQPDANGVRFTPEPPKGE